MPGRTREIWAGHPQRRLLLLTTPHRHAPHPIHLPPPRRSPPYGFFNGLLKEASHRRFRPKSVRKRILHRLQDDVAYVEGERASRFRLVAVASRVKDDVKEVLQHRSGANLDVRRAKSTATASSSACDESFR